MTRRKRFKPTLRERGMKPAYGHRCWDGRASVLIDEVECGWCEHEKWEKSRRAQKLHDLSFNRHIIEEVPW